MHKAVDELANKETFHGYGPEQGYDFLIDAVIRNDYAPRGVYLEPGEVFISDGAKSDTGNIRVLVRGKAAPCISLTSMPVTLVLTGSSVVVWELQIGRAHV